MTERAADDPFARGVLLHNTGKYFEAHEAWELLWKTETNEDARLVLQGLIQITAAFHKLFVMHNASSAQNLLARGLAKLEPASDHYRGIDLKQFRQGVARCEERLASGTMDESAVPKLQLAVFARS